MPPLNILILLVALDIGWVHKVVGLAGSVPTRGGRVRVLTAHDTQLLGGIVELIPLSPPALTLHKYLCPQLGFISCEVNYHGKEI